MAVVAADNKIVLARLRDHVRKAVIGLGWLPRALSRTRASSRENRSRWHHTGDNLAAMAAIDAKVGISGQQERIGQGFGHPHEASVG
jgi:hypothetical protein